MWEYGGLWIGVWHPLATGRLARWRQVEKMIEHMLGKGGVWFARMEDIAAYVQACIDDGSYTPRVDNLPYFTPSLQTWTDRCRSELARESSKAVHAVFASKLAPTRAQAPQRPRGVKPDL